MMSGSKWKSLLISLAVSLGTGAAAGFVTAGSMEQYEMMYRPPLSPPGWVFPVVWGVLYLLMGIAAWLVFISENPDRKHALALYAAQLAVNALWPILYFRSGTAVVSGIPYPEGILSHINAGWDVHDSLSAVDILRLLSESVCCTVSYIKRPKKGYPDRNRKGGQII